MRIGSLFSGIGGLDLGLEQATGGEVAWFCENDLYARAVLKRHWPDVPCYEDVREIDASVPKVDILAGGFPCQDISCAGKGAGLKGGRSGLWFEFARVIRLLRPTYVFVENVPALASRGLGDVLGDLASCGYDAEWDCIGACCVGAPHRRLRMFIVAADPQRGQLRHKPERPATRRLDASASRKAESRDHGPKEPLADADRGGRQVVREPKPRGLERPHGHESDGCGEIREQLDAEAPSDPYCPGRQGPQSESERWRTGPPDRGWWRSEPDVGRVADGVACRVDRLRCLGNAVVPAQAAAAWQLLSQRLAP